MLFIIARKHAPQSYFNLFIDQLRCVTSRILDEDPITWQFKNQSRSRIFEAISLVLNILTSNTGEL